jgi:site-specific DNA-cytosine methylase
MANKKYTVGGLFSGVGGIELGFMNNGFEVLWSNDIDEASAVTFRKNFNHKHILQDIHTLKGKDLDPVDVLVGGFPCQAFSIAGYRKGFDDDRGNLFFEIIRLVNELKERPKVLFLENVKNFYTHDKGHTFKVVSRYIREEWLLCIFRSFKYFSNLPKSLKIEKELLLFVLMKEAHAILDHTNMYDSILLLKFFLQRI